MNTAVENFFLLLFVLWLFFFLAASEVNPVARTSGVLFLLLAVIAGVWR